MVYTSHYDSPISALLLAERDEKLVGLWMEGQKYFLGSLREDTQERESSPVLRQAGLLEGEGVSLKDSDHVDLKQYQWNCE